MFDYGRIRRNNGLGSPTYFGVSHLIQTGADRKIYDEWPLSAVEDFDITDTAGVWIRRIDPLVAKIAEVFLSPSPDKPGNKPNNGGRAAK